MLEAKPRRVRLVTAEGCAEVLSFGAGGNRDGGEAEAARRGVAEGGGRVAEALKPSRQRRARRTLTQASVCIWNVPKRSAKPP